MTVFSRTPTKVFTMYIVRHDFRAVVFINKYCFYPQDWIKQIFWSRLSPD